VKRFFQRASAEPVAGGHGVLLDGRPLRTPGKSPLRLPSARLAAAVAAEWQGQGETIVPAAMPLTRLASTAIDRMPALRQAAIDEAAAYAGTELLCYRASGPLELVQRQQRGWQPLLDWLAATQGIRLTVTTGLVPVDQPEDALAGVRAAIERLDDWTLVGVHAATTTSGSIIIALALLAQRIDAGEAFALSLLDELFEIERWGQEVESARRQRLVERDLAAAALWLEAVGDAAPARDGNGV
jgi:chaperone required for assembly of F1-ATPase